MFLERGKAAPRRLCILSFKARDATLVALSSGMMKRSVIKNLGKKERKYALCLMLAGFAALNTGFTSQTNEIGSSAYAESVSTVEELADDKSVEVAENITELKVQAAEADLNSVEIVEEPVRENVVETSYGAINYSNVMSMEATAYLPADGNGAGITATGVRATYGVVAVDPRIIPLGSKVYIPGYGVALAADTGGAIRGYRIDLCMESYSQAMQFGRRNVTVYVLE